MKPKHLVLLAIVLVVLGGLVMLKRSGQEPPSLVDQVQLKALLPEGIEGDSIARIEIYPGGKSDEALVLEREESGEGWVVATHFLSPVNQEKMDGFLDTLTGLKGEFRATASGDEFTNYKLDAETAFHFKGFAAGASEPLFHILTGKAPTFGDSFARADGSEDIYILDLNLRRDAGLYTLTLDDMPEPGIWLDKDVLDVEETEITRIALTYPDKAVGFEYREVEVPQEEPEDAEEETEDAEEETETEGGEDADEEEDAETPAPVTERRWVVASGGTGEELNVTAVSNLARKLAGLRATDLVDPEKSADWGLDAPGYICRLGIEGRDGDLVIEMGLPSGERYAYVRFPDAEKNLVYKISGYDFEQVFQVGGKFFELPGILVDKEDVDTIEYATDEGRVVLSKSEDTWRIATPTSDATPVEGKLDSIVRTLLSWKAADYADGIEGTGLDDSPAKVTFTGEGVSHTIAVGNAGPSEKGFYAHLDRLDQVLVMSTRDQDNIFVSPSDLFEPYLFDVSEDAITRVELTQDGATRVLENDDGTWTVTGSGESHDADDAVSSDLRAAISVLKAEKLKFDGGAPGDTVGTILFVTDDGEENRFSVHAEEDGLNLVTLPGKQTGYWIEPAYVDRLFPAAEALEKAPPAEEEPADEEELTDEEEPADEEESVSDEP